MLKLHPVDTSKITIVDTSNEILSNIDEFGAGGDLSFISSNKITAQNVEVDDINEVTSAQIDGGNPNWKYRAQ